MKQLRGFLGFTSFYRRFIKIFASLSFDLTELLNSAAQKSLDSLRKALTQAHVLALPNFTDAFILQTDASGTGKSTHLIQKVHPILYFSKTFCPKLLNSSTYVGELHAITTSVQKWHHYLLGRQFITETDQKSLKPLMNQTIVTPAQHYYLSKLFYYNTVIVYK